jgi:uncharacterized protein (UPF0333 family)
MRSRGQAALDFLLTYGWVFLVIATAIAAIFVLGLVDTGTFSGSQAIGFSQVQPVDWALASNGSLSLRLKNNAGTNISISNIYASYYAGNCTKTQSLQIKNGDQADVAEACVLPAPIPKESYSITLQINYTDAETGMGSTYSDTGTINGRAL